MTRGGFLVGYPTSRRKIPIPEKAPSPKNHVDKKSSDLQKSPIPEDKNPHSPG